MARARVELTDLLSDHLGTFARARESGWIADVPFGVGVVTHEEVRTFLADPRLRANFPEFLRTLGVTAGPFYDWMSGSPLNRDGSDHAGWRSLMSRTFTPRSVEKIRPFLRDTAHALIDRFAARGSCDFVAEFADAFPSFGLCELIGVPQEDRDRFRGWANTIGLGFSPVGVMTSIAQIDAALVQLLEYAGELAEKRRAEPRDDLVSRIAKAAEEDGWDLDGIRGSIAGLVFAGHETTKNQLGWTVAALSGRADLWDAMHAGSLPVADVVEEVLRYRSAATGVGRTVTEPVEHKGERLEPGTNVLLSIWSADHDPAAYSRPDDLDPVAHRDVPHLAFGHGAHFCLGAALARAELQEGLAALTARLTCPTVGDGALWKPPVGINGPDRLPITFVAR